MPNKIKSFWVNNNFAILGCFFQFAVIVTLTMLSDFISKLYVVLSLVSLFYLLKKIRDVSVSAERRHKDYVLNATSHMHSVLTLPISIIHAQELLEVWWDSHFRTSIIGEKLLPKLEEILPKLPKGNKLSVANFEIGDSPPQVVSAIAKRNEVAKNSVVCCVVYFPFI